jgi:hypothetical protein
MTGERAFTYVPGKTFLHRWSSRYGTMPRAGLATKVLFFFVVEAAITRGHEFTTIYIGVTTNAIVTLMSILGLGAAAGRLKARALVYELWSIARLTIIAGLPMFGAVIALSRSLDFDAGYSLNDAPRIFLLLAAVMSALLAVAALFMATTSLADIVAAIPGSGRARSFIALTLISLARAEPDLLARLAAVRELDVPRTKNWWGARLRTITQYPMRMLYLLTTMVWQLISVTSVPVYLSLQMETHPTKERSL